MAGSPDADDTPGPDGSRPFQRDPLTPTERRRALLAGGVPVLLAVVVLAPFAVVGPATVVDVVVAAVVYGGLVGLAAAFLYVDRVHARQCPRCGRRGEQGVARCPGCGYDLQHRPRYACDQRHRLYLDPGLCECGRRLQELPTARGIGREVVVMLKFGAWLLAFLVGMGLLLRYVGS